MIRILTPADQPALEAFLLPRLSTSMFLLSNMRNAGIIDGPARYQGAYAAEFDGARITGVLAHYWNGNLIPQAPLEALPELLDAVLAASGREVKGVLGPGDTVTALAACIPHGGGDVQVDEHEWLYALDLAQLRVPASHSSGKVTARRATPEDCMPMTALSTGFGIEVMGAIDTPETIAAFVEAVKTEISERRLWLLEDRGVIVAKSNFNAQLPEVVQIGGVYTLLAFRGRGHARAVVAQSLLDARTEGARSAILFTGTDNLPAQRAYESLGFERAGDFRILLFRSG